MPDREPVVHSDPETLGGTPVFVGTRVPLKNLLDYLAAGVATRSCHKAHHKTSISKNCREK